MQELTLLQRVERMRRRITNGAVVPAELEALLAEVNESLTQAQAAPVHDPVASALRTLSYSEMEATSALLIAMPEENGGLLVASQVADREGITRSVIVSALRKFESAGVMQCRSLGMKGTHIKLLGGLTVRVLLERIETFDRKVA